MLRVRATKLGFYGGKRRYEGDVFELIDRPHRDNKTLTAEQQFSKSWMEKLDDDQPDPTPKPTRSAAAQTRRKSNVI